MTFVPTLRILALAAAVAATVLTAIVPAQAGTEAMLLVEADTHRQFEQPQLMRLSS